MAFVFFAFYASWPDCADYTQTYDPIMDAYWRGETRLYDAQSRGFFNAPWAVLVLSPFTALPARVGQAALNTLTLVIATLAARAFTNKPVAVVFAVATMHTFNVLIHGQIDGLILGGVMMAWYGIKSERPRLVGLALPVLLIKPTGVFLVVLFCLRWLWVRRAWYAAWPTIGALVSSVMISGLDWPARYLSNLSSVPPLPMPQSTIWRVLDGPQSVIVATVALMALVGWWRLGCTRKAFLLALATGLLFSPYVLSYHYVLLIPVLAALADKNIWLGALAYLTTLTPLLRVQHNVSIAIDAGYPLVLVVLGWFVFKDSLTYTNDNRLIGGLA